MKKEKYIDKLNLIVKILTNHLTKKNKKLLFNTLKEIQENQEISLEFIRYLLLNVQRSSEIEKCKKKKIKEVYTKIGNLRRLLEKNGVKIELRPVTYKVWQNQIDLIKIPKQKFWRFFRV